MWWLKMLGVKNLKGSWLMVGKLTPDDIVTASRVPVLLGLSPYKTPNELLKEAIEAAAGNPPSRLSMR